MPPHDADQKLQAFLAQHYGVITRSAARSAGLSDRQIRLRIESGRWRRRSDQVFVLEGTTASREQELLAAAWAVDGLCSHASAGWLLGVLDDCPDTPVGSSDRNHRHGWDWLELHRPKELAAQDRTRRRRIPVTSVERTLFDLGAIVDLATQRACIDRALGARLTHPERLLGRLAGLARHGRPGSSAARRLVDEFELERGLTESELEAMLVRLLVHAGLPAPTLQHPVAVDGRRYRIDCCYPDLLIAIEADGFAVHGSRASFENDRRRQNDLVLLGWRVLRFTWRQIRDDPDGVVAHVRAAIRAAERPSGAVR